jgi:hypothetical protein
LKCLCTLVQVVRISVGRFFILALVIFRFFASYIIYTLQYQLDKTFAPETKPALANFEKPTLKTRLGFAKIEKLDLTLNHQNRAKVL